MAATSFSPGVRHPAISAPITIAIMGIRENLSAAIVSAPLCQVGWSQARILPAQDRGLVPFLDLEFVAREHRAHRVADILKPGRGRGQHNRCNVPVAAQRSEEHTSDLQSLMRRSYAVFSLKK